MTPSPTGPAPVTSTGPASCGGTTRADEANRMRRSADRIQQQRRQAVLDVIGHRQQAIFRNRQIFRIAAGPVPADQAGNLRGTSGYRRGGRRRSGRNARGYRPRSGGHACGWPGCSTTPKISWPAVNSAPLCHSLKSEPHSAVRDTRTSTSPALDVGNPHALDRDAFVAVKYGRFHGGVGSIDCCHFDACISPSPRQASVPTPASAARSRRGSAAAARSASRPPSARPIGSILRRRS